MEKPMSCRAFNDHLNAYLDSEVDKKTRLAMTRHAQQCPDCGERLETMTRLLTMCAELDENLVIPLEAQAAWRKAVRAESRKKVRRRGSGFTRFVSGLAAALVLLFGGTFLYRQGGTLPLASVTGGETRTIETRDTQRYFSPTSAVDSAPAALLDLESDGAVDEAVAENHDAGETGSVAPGTSDVVVLRSARRKIESTAFDQSYQTLRDLVDEYNGYFEDTSVSGEAGSQNSRKANLTARVPEAQLEDFLTSLDAVSTVTYKSESAEDISGQYYDTKTRLESYQAQVKRLNELVATAANLEDMLLLEERLADAQMNIDSIEGQLRLWNSRASYATVTITLSEVAPRDQVRPAATSLQERIQAAFYDSVNWLNGFWQDATVVLAAAAPLLVIVLPAIILVWIIVAGIRRRRRRRGR